jgi:hypothetical protein
MTGAILKTVAYRVLYKRSRQARWQVARTLYGINSLVFDYRWEGLQRFVHRIWPVEYSREAPPWALREPWFGQK